jgi:hypothetical protein
MRDGPGRFALRLSLPAGGRRAGAPRGHLRGGVALRAGVVPVITSFTG